MIDDGREGLWVDCWLWVVGWALGVDVNKINKDISKRIRLLPRVTTV